MSLETSVSKKKRKECVHEFVLIFILFQFFNLAISAIEYLYTIISP